MAATISQAERQVEERWLQQVLAVLRERLAEVGQLAGAHKERVRTERRSMWEEGPHFIRDEDDIFELAQRGTELARTEKGAIFYAQMQRRLERMAASPYFGRIDFRPSGEDGREAIYIGITSLHEEPSGRIMVHDWRAPICSLFYDAEVGLAQFTAESGPVTGELLLKRQYKIAGDRLHFMFDTNLKIDDEALQELLARHVDEKMRTIVTSIQREQNKVIRDDAHSLVVVDGPAGSGKTAIALHRAAYLLYRHRDTITADNIVIFSPNDIFADYISAVLPALGEENVRQLTFQEFAERALGPQVQVESQSEQYEFLLSGPGHPGYDARVAGLQYKTSPAFLRLLRAYVTRFEQGCFTALSGVYHQKKPVIEPAEMQRLFLTSYEGIPFARRLLKLEKRALYLLAPLEEQRLQEWRAELRNDPELLNWQVRQESRRRTTEEFSGVKEWLRNWAHFDLFAVYRRLFTDRQLFADLAGAGDAGIPERWPEICEYTLARLEQGCVWHEDAGPLLYLQRLLTGWPKWDSVKHVIVDEAQDYSELQYELLGLAFPYGNFTVLGDLNQAIHPDIGVGRYEQALIAIRRRSAAVVQLSRSYRSTRQIMTLAQSILPGARAVETVERDGVLPRLVQVEVADGKAGAGAALGRALGDGIAAWRVGGWQTIAVICKTAVVAAEVYKELSRHERDIVLISREDRAFRTGVLVLPVYLAKGLEFDCVAVVGADAATYGREADRRLLYVACTRALHELRLYCTGRPSPFLPALEQL